MSILVLNAGSSSLKIGIFGAGFRELASGMVGEIGGRSQISVGSRQEPCEAGDHKAALMTLLDAFAGTGHPMDSFAAAGHRVVHGGRALTQPCRLTDAAVAAIEACVPIAPLHNPANLAGIRALRELVPELPQAASFDTAFHATNPEVALRYAIPAEEDAKGIRRYGFHGISYASLVEALPRLSGAALPRRLLALHLGNGASLCAIRDGRSVASSMGYSPLEGLTMGTRAGGIDGMAVLRLAREHGIDAAERILNRESGLKALGGASDMRALHAAGTDEARFAIEHFCYWAVRHAGSAIAAMGGLDAVAFTGGIGENDAEVRARIMGGLAWTGLSADADANRSGGPRLHAEGSRVAVWIVPAAEERRIAVETAACLGLAP